MCVEDAPSLVLRAVCEHRAQWCEYSFSCREMFECLCVYVREQCSHLCAVVRYRYLKRCFVSVPYLYFNVMFYKLVKVTK